jgi:hypothetical protein
MVSGAALLMQRLAEANPAPPDADLPGLATVDEVLAAVVGRRGEIPTDRSRPPAPAPSWQGGPAIAVAAFVLVIGLGAVVLGVAGRTSSRVAVVATTEGAVAVPRPSASEPAAGLSMPALDSFSSTGFEAEIVEEDPGAITGTFTATGPAVEAGLVCAVGTTAQWNRNAGNVDQNESWDTIFECGDGSGAFRGHFEADYLYTAEGTTYHGGWEITEGTGAYTTLEGGGGSVGGSSNMPGSGSSPGR